MGRRVIFMCVVAVLAAGIQPWLWSWVRDQAAEFHNRRSEAEQLLQLIDRVESVRGALAKQQPFINEIAIVAPRQQDVVQAIEALERMATSFGVAIVVKDISESMTGNLEEAEETVFTSVEPLVVSLAAGGEPAALLLLIDGAERLPFMTRLAQLKLVPSRPGTAAAELGRFTLTADILFFVQRDYDTTTATQTP